MDGSNLAQGFLNLGGYDQLKADLDTLRTGLTEKGGTFDTVRSDITNNTQFSPYGVRSNIGRTDAGPEGIEYRLSDPQNDVAHKLRYNGMQNMMSTMGDRSGRESEIYDRIRAMQMPGEQRAQSQMDNRLVNQGRSGMYTSQFGGSPEQHAMAMAQGEAQNQAAYSAMGQAENEMMNTFARGQGMLTQSYDPLKMLMAQQAQGMTSNAQNLQSGQHAASLLAQLGLGEAGTLANLSNIQGEALTGLLSSISPAVGQAGQAVGDFASAGLEKTTGLP